MATIYKRKRKDGKVAFYFNITVNGQRVRRFAGYSMDVAKDNLKKLEYDLTFNLSESKSSKSFDDSLQSFKKFLASTNISDRQVKTVYNKVNWFGEYCLSKKISKLQDIKSKHAIDYISKRSQILVNSHYNCVRDSILKKISPNTLNREIGFINRFFEYCIDMEWIKTNPFRAVKRYKLEAKKERYYFSKNDIKLIMESALKFADFYTFLLDTGLRPTDAFKLQNRHINGSYLDIKMNKTGDYLSIPLTESTIRLLRARNRHEYIFPEVRSDQQRRNALKNIQRLFSPEFVRNNNITLHTFRHTYAHNMLNRGVPKEVLQTLLGHRSIKTTEIYANWVKKDELRKWIISE